MQFYNKLKNKQQQSQHQQQDIQNNLELQQNKPPLVESRSQWNSSVYLVPKWEKKLIKRIDANLHVPFPIRNYINYVKQHSGGFKEQLNLDFFQHIFRHFSINQWWIDETKRFKATIPLNYIQQLSETTKQNPQYRKLILQKQVDDINFYKKILRNIKSPIPPSNKKSIQEYRKSITYQILDPHAGLQYKDKSLFQLQEVFINRIIQLISEFGIGSLSYYDYLTFKNIVQDRIKGLGDAKQFTKILEIRKLYNQINIIQEQNNYDHLNNNIQKEVKHFRRWTNEKILTSEQAMKLATQVGLSVNLIRARENYESNKTESNYKELVKIGDNIQLKSQKTVLNVLQNLPEEDYNNLSNHYIEQPLIYQQDLAIAREIYQEQKNIINQEYELDDDDNNNNESVEQNSLESELEMNIDQPQETILNLNKLDDKQQISIQRTSIQRNGIKSVTPSKRVVIISENIKKQKKETPDRQLISQQSKQSFKSQEDLIKPKNKQIDEQQFQRQNRNNEFKTINFQDNPKLQKQQYQKNIEQKLYTINSTNQNQSNIYQKSNESVNEDIKILHEFVNQNKIQQNMLTDKLFKQEKETEELLKLQEELENISREESFSTFSKKDENKIENIKQQQSSNNNSSSHIGYGYKVPIRANGSNSNVTTARTSRINSNNNQQRKQIIISQQEASDVSKDSPIKRSQHYIYQQQQIERMDSQNEQQQIAIVINEFQNESKQHTEHKSIKLLKEEQEQSKQSSSHETRLLPPNISRQTSIKKSNKSQKSKSPKEDLLQQSRYDIKTEVRYETNVRFDTKMEEHRITSQNSSDLSQSRNSPDQTIRFQKSVKNIIEKNKKVKIDNDDKQKRRKSKQIDLSQEEEDEIDKSKDDNKSIKLKKQKSVRKQFQSISMPKIGEDQKKYLVLLKEELKEMMNQKVNLQEIKIKINEIMNEISGLKIDSELDYYLQLYKQRVQELSMIGAQSREIIFQTIRPTIDIKFSKEMKGLKFGRNCDHIPKLTPQDLEDVVIQSTEHNYEQEKGNVIYQPVYQYLKKNEKIETNLIQESLDFTRKETPITYRLENRETEILPKLLHSERIRSKKISPQAKRQTHLQKSIDHNKLEEDFPYLQKYKPGLLKSLIEAKINLQ